MKTSPLQNRPRVGIGIFLINQQGRILLGNRMNAHGANTWSIPGGHLDFGEEIIDCAQREAREETGLIAKGIKILGLSNAIFEKEDLHYVSILTICEPVCEEPELKEPKKCEAWKWFALEDFPKNIFLPLNNFLKDEQNKTKLINEINSMIAKNKSYSNVA